jgi:hypothetical protein
MTGEPGEGSGNRMAKKRSTVIEKEWKKSDRRARC